VRKAYNELRSRWEDVRATGRRETSELSECSYASTPLVTHGAWRGHTFASASMHTFFKQHLQSYMNELQLLYDVPDIFRQRNRGRKSKKTAYLMDVIARLKYVEESMEHDPAFDLFGHWSELLERS
jgi:hypothetical protein